MRPGNEAWEGGLGMRPGNETVSVRGCVSQLCLSVRGDDDPLCYSVQVMLNGQR